MSIPLDELTVTGIGPIQITRFREAGIADVHALASADPDLLDAVALPDDLVADAVDAARTWLRTQRTPAERADVIAATTSPIDVDENALPTGPLRTTRRIRIVRKLAQQARRHAKVLPEPSRRKTRKRLGSLRTSLRDDQVHWHRAGLGLAELREALHAFLVSTPDVDSARALRRALKAVLQRHGV